LSEDKYEWLTEVEGLKSQLNDFSKYLADKTMKNRGNQGRKRLKITPTQSYISLAFKIKLDDYVTHLKFPRSKRIIEYADDFEKLFRLVLAHVLKIMLKNKKGYEVEYKGGGEIEFSEKRRTGYREDRYGRTVPRYHHSYTSAAADSSTTWTGGNC
jgi:hypothetical protein